MSSNIDKYIKKCGINGKWTLFPKPQKKYKNIIVIPAYAELDYIFNTLESIDKCDVKCFSDIMVVVVVNNENEALNEVILNNKKTLRMLFEKQYSYFLSIIDASTNEFCVSSKYAGVGMARKIGMDLVLKYCFSDSLLYCLDADTIVSKKYFKIIQSFFGSSDSIAAVVGFSHLKSDNKLLEIAIREYESFLNITAINLNRVGSPYGYISMGSTIICKVDAYIAVGGMPNKKATEDFYFLQKFAKYKRVDKINEVLVYPSARASDRVFLGTGFRMSQFLLGKKIKDLFYPIKAFIILEDWLLIATSGFNKDIKDIMFQAQSISIDLYDFLKKENIENIWNKISENSTTENQFVSQFHRWFDALKTYRFLNTYIS